MLSDSDIRKFLEITFVEANKAFDEGNYPIGSLLVNEKLQIISKQHNRCSTNFDLTAHSEILNLREIGLLKRGELTLFSSLEPCFGCSFFLARSSITNIFSALKDPHKGGIGDLKPQHQFESFFSKVEIVNEPFRDLADESRDLMFNYFIRIGKPDKAQFYRH